MAKWSRQTYEMVANGIQSEQGQKNGDQVVKNLAHYFAGQFSADNPTFKRDLFLTACGVKQAKGA